MKEYNFGVINKNDNRKIGVFDSGIGGATVVKEIVKVLPNEDYVYYSDSKNNPYGDKDEKTIITICEQIVDKLIKFDCKAIVIACNTASAKSADYLRRKYYDLPIIAIEPAYKMVHDFAYDKKTLVMATRGTLESEKFHRLYEKYNNNNTYLMECRGLADIIELGDEAKIKSYLEKNLIKYAGNIDNVVLGCTHYPLIKEPISQVLGDVDFFDGSFYLAMHLKKILTEKGLICNSAEKGVIEFIDSSNSESKKRRFFKYLSSQI